MNSKTYIAIDLKSFYASVECAERGLDPLTTNLVVADITRTEKTICLAVTPALKSIGVPGRPRLFEVLQITQPRGIDFITAPPRMALYMEYSSRIYNIYLRYIAPEDIHVYSIDEVFIDATSYLSTYKLSAHDLTMKLIREVLSETGITATAGIGTNLYLAKIAMDIVAKHIPADADGVRIAELNERTFREKLWSHRKLTDFWRIGKGYVKKLNQLGLFTMGDIARCSLGKEGDYYNENLLYKIFGVNAELLIDHAWGWEPCTMEDIKAYRSKTNSICQGQVLTAPYDYDKTKIIVREMAEFLSLDLVYKNLVTDQIVLTVGYDIENLTNPEIKKNYHGPIKTDHYGRSVPVHAHGSINLSCHTSSESTIIEATLTLFDRIINPNLLCRRINITAGNVVYSLDLDTTAKTSITESGSPFQSQDTDQGEQLSFFNTSFDKEPMEIDSETQEKEKIRLEKEHRLQEAELSIKKRYGKNAILRGTNFLEGATARERNSQIGGHKA